MAEVRTGQVQDGFDRRLRLDVRLAVLHQRIPWLVLRGGVEAVGTGTPRYGGGRAKNPLFRGARASFPGLAGPVDEAGEPCTGGFFAFVPEGTSLSMCKSVVFGYFIALYCGMFAVSGVFEAGA